MAIDEKILQEELAMLKADFDKTKKQIEGVEKEIVNMRNNLMQFTALCNKLKNF